MKLQTILKVQDKLNVHSGSYLYGTFRELFFNDDKAHALP